MKTFNCTQCGASIERISMRDRWAHCDYCKTRFHLPEEKRPIVTSLTFGVISASDPDSDGPELGYLWKAAFVVILPSIIVYGGIKTQEELRAREESSRIEKAKKAQLSEVNKVTNVPVSVKLEDGSDDVLSYELPTLDTTSFALARRIENSSGSKYVVVVRVNLDPEGNVRETEALAGNIMLQQFATKAARNTVFSPNAKKKTRKITYTFG